MSKIRVLIVDDHPVVRHGLHNMLKSTDDIAVVGEAGGGTEVLEKVSLLNPDVILLDIRMPGLTGLQVVERLQQKHEDVKIIILTSHSDDEYIFGALQAGAHGYLLKSVAHEKLADAVRTAYSGKRMLSPDLVGRVLEEFQALAQTSANQGVDLTEREVAILQLIAAGHTNKEIAEELHWSVVTIKRKISEVFTKLNVKTRAQAVAEALKRGII